MRSTLSSPPARGPLRPSIPARIGAGLELALALVGVPVGFIVGLGRQSVLHIPHPPTPGQLRQLLTGPPQLLVDATLHSLIWVVWALWAYLVFVIALSALGQLAAALRPGRAVPGIFRLRNAVVPTSLQLILDTVFIAALVTPHVKAPTSVRTLPATPAVVQMATPPPSARATLLAQVSATPTPAASTYIVKRGDTLSGVAEDECGTAALWPAIAEANQATIPHPDLIHAGDVVQLPPDCDPGQGVESGGQVHVVAPGESLWSIAEAVYGDGSEAAAIFDANAGQVVGSHGERLERPRFIEAGWRLVLPDLSRATLGSPLPAPAGPAPVPSAAIPPVSTPLVQPLAPTPSATATVSPRPSPAAATPASRAPAVAGPIGRPGDPAGKGVSPRRSDPAAPREDPSLQSRTHGAPVRLPGGWMIPASFGAVLLALVARARARKLRGAPLDARPIRVAAEGPVLTSLRRAGTGASFDPLGTLAEPVLRAWAAKHDGRVPAVLACWESAADTAFLLDESEAEQLPQSRVLEDLQIRFEAGGGGVWAIASGTGPARLRRGINAFADGLLVPVGSREQDAALHMPLFGPLMSVAGPGAAAVIEAMVLAARARCSPDDLSIVVVGGEDLLADTLGEGGDDDLPAIRRVAVEDQEQMRLELEAQVLANATTVADYGLSDLGRHALEHPDDRPSATLVILDPAVVPAWLPLLIRGRRLGLAGVVAGECSSAERSLVMNDDGSLAVCCAGVDATVINPCALPPGGMEEVATAVRDEPQQPEEDSAAPDLEELADETAAPVRIQLFGSLQIINATGEVIPQPGRNRRSTRDLLAYLACRPGWHRKEELCSAINDTDDFASSSEEIWAGVSEARRWLLTALGPQGEGIQVSGRSLIQNKGSQGYRLATDLISVDVLDFERAFAAAKANPASVGALRAVVGSYRNNLLVHSDNPDAFSWVERDGLRMKLQVKVAWAAVTLSDLLQDRGQPRQALSVLEPLLDMIPNEDLWIRAMRCQGEPVPRGLGDRAALIGLFGRFQSDLKALALEGVTPKAEAAYKALLAADPQREVVRLDAVERAVGGQPGGGNGDASRLRLVGRAERVAAVGKRVQ